MQPATCTLYKHCVYMYITHVHVCKLLSRADLLYLLCHNTSHHLLLHRHIEKYLQQVKTNGFGEYGYIICTCTYMYICTMYMYNVNVHVLYLCIGVPGFHTFCITQFSVHHTTQILHLQPTTYNVHVYTCMYMYIILHTCTVTYMYMYILILLLAILSRKKRKEVPKSTTINVQIIVYTYMYMYMCIHVYTMYIVHVHVHAHINRTFFKCCLGSEGRTMTTRPSK